MIVIAEATPEKFNSRLKNKIFYAGVSACCPREQLVSVPRVTLLFFRQEARTSCDAAGKTSQNISESRWARVGYLLCRCTVTSCTHCFGFVVETVRQSRHHGQDQRAQAALSALPQHQQVSTQPSLCRAVTTDAVVGCFQILGRYDAVGSAQPDVEPLRAAASG